MDPVFNLSPGWYEAIIIALSLVTIGLIGALRLSMERTARARANLTKLLRVSIQTVKDIAATAQQTISEAEKMAIESAADADDARDEARRLLARNPFDSIFGAGDPYAAMAALSNTNQEPSRDAPFSLDRLMATLAGLPDTPPRAVKSRILSWPYRGVAVQDLLDDLEKDLQADIAAEAGEHKDFHADAEKFLDAKQAAKSAILDAIEKENTDPTSGPPQDSDRRVPRYDSEPDYGFQVKSPRAG